ncbi:MFS general substrate transporter [Neolentinus lepideus HHB14362 ss-1]|uniref:MFS general substrate transporter n=1 Tax=Neolentinus lepideus HHB14362 ss-1 TaxID=1314782 RepID=A0A165PBL2_9AGAM|nr:MFS general substrate transporter [Neolentinus lepideus HHB14362 ss-1]
MAAQEPRPSTPASVDTSFTHVRDRNEQVPQDGEGESAIPEDKKEEVLENLEDDWQHDPINPRNWSGRQKWLVVSLVSLYTFVSPLASSVMAPALPEIAVHYGITNATVVAMTLSIFLLSFALGPLFLAPLSEMYGRTWVLHIGNIVFLGLNLGCAFSPTGGALIAFRFLSGFAGSAPIACGGGSISDLFSERDRASAMAVYTIGPLIGPVVGPIIGGYVSQAIGFKYVFVIVAGLGGFASALAIPLLKETYAPIIRLRRDRKSSDSEKAAARHPHLTQEHGSKLRLLWINVSRPFVLLTRSFICFILSAYMALMYGIYYLMFSTFPDLFSEVYHFSLGSVGLAYIGLGVGFLLATFFGAWLSDRVYAWFSARNGGVGKPEYRVPALIFGSLWVPIGLFWYGWSAAAQIHWVMPIIGTGIFGFGLMATFLPISLYLVDTFTFAASAVAAASVFRSMLGFAFPLFGAQMFKALGVGGGNSLLAGLAIVLGIPAPIWIFFYGEQIRSRSSLSR